MNEGFKKGMVLELIYSLMICFICFTFAEPLMKLFSDDSTVIAHGVNYLHIIAFMYVLPAFTNGIQGYFRGIGRVRLTLAASFVNMGVRVVFAAFFAFAFDLKITALPWSYFAGWVAMLVMEVPILVKAARRHR